MQVVPNTDLVVGDVLLVNMGDKVVADGIMIDGFHLVVDEASLTGTCTASQHAQASRGLSHLLGQSAAFLTRGQVSAHVFGHSSLAVTGSTL